MEAKTGNPLLLKNILEVVFAYVDQSELRQCRLVCKVWNEVSSRLYENTCFMEPFLSSWGDSTRFSRFVKVFYNDQETFMRPQKILFTLNNDSSLDKGLDMLEVCGNEIKSLDFHCCPELMEMHTVYRTKQIMQLNHLTSCLKLTLSEFAPNLTSTFTESLRLAPTIVHLEIKQSFLDVDVMPFEAMSYYYKLIQHCNLITNLGIELEFSYSLADNEVETNFTYISVLKASLMKFIQACRLLKLKSLTIRMNYENEDGGILRVDHLGSVYDHYRMLNMPFNQLLDIPFPLETLVVSDIISKDFSAFLEQYAETLKSVEVSFSESFELEKQDCTYRIPVLEHVYSINLPYYYGKVTEKFLSKLPNLRQITLTGLFASCTLIPSKFAELSTTFLREPSRAQSSVKIIKMYFMDQAPTTERTKCDGEDYALAFVNQFTHLNELYLFSSCDKFLVNFFQTAYVNLTRIEIDGINRNNTLRLDCVLTGYQSEVCINLENLFASSLMSYFENFNSTTWHELCALPGLQQTTAGIDKLCNLQYVGLREVPVNNLVILFLLKNLDLTALEVEEGNIRTDLVNYLQNEVFYPGFYFQLISS